MVRIGLSPTDVLRSAMTVAARTLGLEDDVGRIADGYVADVIAGRESVREYPGDGGRQVRDAERTGGEGSVGRGNAGLQAGTARRKRAQALPFACAGGS